MMLWSNEFLWVVDKARKFGLCFDEANCPSFFAVLSKKDLRQDLARAKADLELALACYRLAQHKRGVWNAEKN